MTQNEFNQWLKQIENECQNDSNILNDADKEKIMDRVKQAIHNPENRNNLASEPELNIDEVLASFNPESYEVPEISGNNSRRHFVSRGKKFKAASIIIICSVILGFASLTYAAANGRLSGVFKSTPELDEQLNVSNSTQTLYDPDQVILVNKPVDCTNSTILSPSSFELPEAYHTVTDVQLSKSDDTYLSDTLIFDMDDIAVFTKKNGSGWSMNPGEKITLTIAIDTSYAACEPTGENIEFSYIYNKKYYAYDLNKITDQEYTFSFIAPEEGEYYLALCNRSFSYIKITSLRIAK